MPVEEKAGLICWRQEPLFAQLLTIDHGPGAAPR